MGTSKWHWDLLLLSSYFYTKTTPDNLSVVGTFSPRLESSQDHWRQSQVYALDVQKFPEYSRRLYFGKPRMLPLADRICWGGVLSTTLVLAQHRQVVTFLVHKKDDASRVKIPRTDVLKHLKPCFNSIKATEHMNVEFDYSQLRMYDPCLNFSTNIAPHSRPYWDTADYFK